MTAKGTFDVHDWTPQPPLADHDGISVAHVTLRKTFHGDLTGSSVVHMTIATTPVEDSRSYVAVERVTGTLDGREGTFLLQHSAAMDRGEQTLRISVVPDSGTGELAGLRGVMDIHIAPDGGHSYTFDHNLEG
ncbi:DUF3224 domain-containing protein [Thermoactinospora rubra]|uniref:DUF3224 domain-containing protein n=1 Tax=Thermoactinospora rubra TaxID=1088767 RepID=UPI000A10C645|nr:DUF3224 domain-containing protein [Thermoactinospora rubra]